MPNQFGWTPLFSANEKDVAWPFVEPLIHVDENSQPKPWLATDWKVDPDGKFVLFNLRKGVRFHDGTEFNAKAVKDSLGLMVKLKPGEIPGVTSIDVVSEYTVRLNTEYFPSIFWDRMCTRSLISSPTHLAKGEDACKFHPVGTGPFKFSSWQRDTYVKGEKFKDYWQKGKPYLDKFEFIFIKDPMTAAAALMAGEAEAWDQASVKETYDLKQKGFEVQSTPAALISLDPDTKNPNSIYRDKKVREALEYAIDRETITRTLGYGYKRARTQFSAPGYMGYVPSLERRYNPEKARQLLSEAGHPKGFNTTIYAYAVQHPRDIMTAVQGYLANVGINAKLEFLEAGRYAEWRRKSGWSNGLMACYNGGFPFTPNLFSFILDEDRKDHFSMRRPDGCHETLQKLMAAGTFEKQTALSEQLTRLLFDDASFIPLWYDLRAVVLRKEVHDMNLYAGKQINQWNPEDVWIGK
ncbi:MAG: hypothetical protein A2162_08775 [Deltaproteobacteria bacterium RBG_13_52_11b]|nr:MAG: hypothetical protein A2162_08775 [Deltaproteobacteria bacterium RBG_13_52_11b]